ncbi:putative vacuolar protein sorting-associated protein 41 like protein [Amylocarpus encephaloides]|uniref:Vacuolar protein sorting-associated protein 41 like protein n=1 Tax=Amylocarpus encephaloides TaxID=45428 RepID=A0A9P8C451_9HELO|nr:putative vacuolar protein sorting-associated protein 41 like protein [Amylocarpus encephaloides]
MAQSSEEQGDPDLSKNEDSNADEGDTIEDEGDTVDSEEDDEEEEEDEEPKLKYTRLTNHLGPVYRNGDATSAFLVAGDKMFIGTHNGNIHVLLLPSFKSLRVYHAHSASISSISISPFPPPLPIAVPEGVSRVASQAQAPNRTSSITSEASTSSPRAPKGRKAPLVPNVPSNAIYIATSGIDGKVCVASLVDEKDVQLRDFARPVQAVALSPDFKNERSYVSGGLAGNLVLTVGGRSGTSSMSTTTGTASAAASGWLGSIGLGSGTGKDTVLHSGEGTISTIKWSLSGKYVVWINEHGVKIMRSNLHLEGADSEYAWKRIGHVDRPQDDGWEEMASVWKGRVEWIDEKSLETDEDDKAREAAASSPATAKLKQQSSIGKDQIEKLLIGWGGTIWIINVHPGGVGVGKNAGERSVGWPEIIKILRMDCIISGLSLYTPTLLLVLAYVTPDEEDEEEDEDEELTPKEGHKSKTSTMSTGSEPRGGIRRRQNALSPELRLIDLGSSQEVDTDTLTVSRFERLSATDYHLGLLPAPQTLKALQTSRGALETLSGMGSGMWNATVNATSLLSSAASVRSTGSNDAGSKAPSVSNTARTAIQNRAGSHPHMETLGMKIFIQSPFDCILATKRELGDRLSWLLQRERYQEGWELLDKHPDIISSSPERLAEIGPSTPDHKQGSTDDFFDDVASTIDSSSKAMHSAVEKEKRRIGELWIQQLIKTDDWVAAGKVCGKVLGTAQQWEEWVYVFVGAKKFDEITNFIPTTQLKPPLPSQIYEVLLGHYVGQNRPKVVQLLEAWSPDLFDIGSVITVLENQLKYRDVRQDSVEDGQVGRDWRIVMESLGKLHVADGRPREALKCYIRLQDADTAMGLIKDHHLVDAVADDIPGLILLRVSKEQKRSASLAELQELTSEAVELLVNEARQGIVRPEVVVDQLEAKNMTLYLFFYLSALWKGDDIEEGPGEVRDRLLAESKALVNDIADLAVHLFALYDRDILMEILKSSTSYTFERATHECEERDYIPELVYLYSKTGQTKRALYLIIDRLADVSQAISFAKEQNDTDLWEDLLNYSMDKPRFIRGLLEEVGTAIDPVTLVRRIPEGLEIEGLREGLSRMIREHDIQYSISSGVAKVLRGEVASAQNTLRSGQRKGVKFDVKHKPHGHLDIETSDAPPPPPEPNVPITITIPNHAHRSPPKAGHCVGCNEPFSEHEIETLVGFACGHVFHLSHLLGYNRSNPSTPPEVDLDENGEWWSSTHSVGAKVTHAALLRDRIRDGCPVCAVVVGAGDDVR